MISFPTLSDRFFRNLFVSGFTFFLVYSCSQPVKNKDKKDETLKTNVTRNTETTTSGHIRIGVDPGLENIIQQEKDAFCTAYQKATIDLKIASEGELIRDLVNDSVRMIVINRPLTKDEAKKIEKNQIKPKSTKIANSGIAVIRHPENPLDSIGIDDFGKIIRGELTEWSQVKEENSGQIAVVYDNPASGIIRYMSDRFMGGEMKLPPNSYTVKNLDEVIDYISRNKKAIGLIPFSSICDRDESQTKSILERVDFLRLQANDTTVMKGEYIAPYQSEIALGAYPLDHGIYIISREYFVGLGTGFVAYVAGELGQRIILKAGLVPEFMPQRYLVFPQND